MDNVGYIAGILIVQQQGIAMDDARRIIMEVRSAFEDPIERIAEKPPETLVPAVAIEASIQPDFIVCLEDGKCLKMLKRHLKQAYNLTPAEYRKRWSLPPNYPMVAPNYAAQRSMLAKQTGLGKK